jgi:hypothetical protein
VHAHFLEVFDAGVGVDQRLPHQHLIGDASRCRPTISWRMPSMSSPGSATMVQALENAVWPVRPISQESTSVTRVPGRTVALGRERGHETACACAHHQHVGVDQHAVELIHSAHHGRGRFLTDGCTSTICSGQKISQLKQVMQCSRNLMTGRSLVWRKPAISTATGCGSMWITSAGQTRSQMPHPVHFSSSMLSIMPCHSKCHRL